MKLRAYMYSHILINMMLSQSAVPEVSKANLLLDNLTPSLRKQVFSSRPTQLNRSPAMTIPHSPACLLTCAMSRTFRVSNS